MATPTVPGSNATGASIAEHRVVEVSSEPVELYKILKFEGLAESGGQAKAAIADGQVIVNGSVELQKRKKIMGGDKIEFNGDKMVIHFAKPSPTTSAAKPQ